MKNTAPDWPKGLKRTKPRAYVLAALQEAQTPIDAAQIYRSIGRGGRNVSLSTVYRTLDALIDKGIAGKTTLPGSDTARYELNRPQHKHYAFCVICSKVIALDDCPMEACWPQIEEGEFQVTGHKVEIYGRCRACTGRDA